MGCFFFLVFFVFFFFLTETIAHGGDYHCFADEKLSLCKDSWLHNCAELNMQVVSYSREQSSPSKDDARWLLRLCHFVNTQLLYSSTDFGPAGKMAIDLTFLRSFLSLSFQNLFYFKKKTCVFFILTFIFFFSLWVIYFLSSHGIF